MKSVEVIGKCLVSCYVEELSEDVAVTFYAYLNDKDVDYSLLAKEFLKKELELRKLEEKTILESLSKNYFDTKEINVIEIEICLKYNTHQNEKVLELNNSDYYLFDLLYMKDRLEELSYEEAVKLASTLELLFV